MLIDKGLSANGESLAQRLDKSFARPVISR